MHGVVVVSPCRCLIWLISADRSTSTPRSAPRPAPLHHHQTSQRANSQLFAVSPNYSLELPASLTRPPRHPACQLALADDMDSVNPIDPWAAPTTKVFALIGVVWLSLKIFSFWRLIASLLIIPGQKVSFDVCYPCLLLPY